MDIKAKPVKKILQSCELLYLKGNDYFSIC